MTGPFEFEIMPFTGETASAFETEIEEFEAAFEFVSSKEFEDESSMYPGISCVTAGNPYVLHCFPPFKTELTKEHHDHLDIIADKIRRSFSTSPITRVTIYGHASTWQATSPGELKLRALQRAGTARDQLMIRLDRMGLSRKVHIVIEGRSDSAPWRGKPYSSTSGSQSAQNDRALNRRVEIYLTRSKKPDPERPKDTCGLGDVLKKVDLSGVEREVRLDYLRKLLILGVCGKTIDDRFWTFAGEDALGRKTNCIIHRPPSAYEGTKFVRVKPRRHHNVPAVFLDRNEKPIRVVQLFKKEVSASRDPKTIRNILIWLEQAMHCNIDMLGQYIELNCEAGASGYRKDPICAFVHDVYKKAASFRPPSVYGCFKSILKEYSTTCTEGCAR